MMRFSKLVLTIISNWFVFAWLALCATVLAAIWVIDWIRGA